MGLGFPVRGVRGTRPAPLVAGSGDLRYRAPDVTTPRARTCGATTAGGGGCRTPQETSGGPFASGRCGPDHAAPDGVRLRASVSGRDDGARARRPAAAVRPAAASGRGDAERPPARPADRAEPRDGDR